MEKLQWTTEQRRPSELVAWHYNPRKMSPKQADQLKASLERFSLVEIPAIDLDNTIIAGHQRIAILIMEGKGDEQIDVRVPNRKLTDEELREYNIRSNANVGSWDFDLLANEFDIDNLKAIGFDENYLDKVVDGDFTKQLDEKKKKETKCPSCGYTF